jgi:hypothetical protein
VTSSRPRGSGIGSSNLRDQLVSRTPIFGGVGSPRMVLTLRCGITCVNHSHGRSLPKGAHHASASAIKVSTNDKSCSQLGTS